MSSTRFACALLAFFPTLPSCVTQEVEKDSVDPKVLEQHESRLMEPYGHGHTVACRTLVIDANPILLRNLALPAGLPDKKKGVDFEELRWSTSDTIKVRQAKKGAKPISAPRRGKLTVTIGTTAFIVDDHVTVRRLFRAAPTLTAHAAGHVMVIRDGKTAETYREVRIADGRVQTR